jgi:hypothetical protein
MNKITQATSALDLGLQSCQSCRTLLSPLYSREMTPEIFQQIIATYRRHGWELRHVLLTPDTRAAITDTETQFGTAELRDDQIDALWFARPSHAGRVAWELRLVAEAPYALFEAFESDETEGTREEKRRQMEARMREYAAS